MRRILSCFLIAVNCLCLCGCSEIVDTVWGNGFIKKIESTPHLAFSKGVLFDGTESILTTKQFNKKHIKYTSYRGSLHYDSLPRQEQIVYRAIEYGMENGYTNILIDNLIINDIDRLPHIVYALSLDSPLLEQNLRFEYGDFTSEFSTKMLGFFSRSAVFDGFYITIKNFENSLWEKKLLAINKATEIVDALPENIDNAQKAERLFYYLANNVVYDKNKYPDSYEVYPYLYDALIGGTSHCDGYANALSLLYNLAGINCVEKSYGSSVNTQEADGSTEAVTSLGHTWNFAQIGDDWYNIDASEKTLVPSVSGTELHGGVLYCFEDDLQQKAPDYNEIYPSVNEGLYLKVDRHLANTNASDFVVQIKSALAEHSNKWALVVVDSLNTTRLEREIQLVVNELHNNLTYFAFSCKDDRTAIFICSSNLQRYFE